MKKIITYGTYDLLHHGHIKLLERAKALGDYLIVGVTSSDFDKKRGKINVQQSLMERIQSVKQTGLADEIIIEEYEGQKIDDIIHYGIDIFTVGSDWEGKFDYLKSYCDVVYLPRTEGVSSSEIRSENRKIKLGLIGSYPNFKKVIRECQFVNGIEVSSICSDDINNIEESVKNCLITTKYDELLENVDAVYIISHPSLHYTHIKEALELKKHVLCESPISLKESETEELFNLAKKNNCILMEGIKTAYSTAYSRLLLLIKSGYIGNIVSIDSTCTSIKEIKESNEISISSHWNSMCSWGPPALLPIFQILGINYKNANIASFYLNKEKKIDGFSKIDFLYDNAVASIKIGKRIKSEGELVISGTKGYIYVPSPWWKTDYFEIRYENTNDNQRYFYQLNGEGIRYELLAFTKSINSKKRDNNIDISISLAISKIIENYYNNVNTDSITIQ